jgi:hypothetical protein
MIATVDDVMRKNVRVVAPSAGFKEIVARLREHRVARPGLRATAAKAPRCRTML